MLCSGACYAMAAVEVLEDRLCIQNKQMSERVAAAGGLRRQLRGTDPQVAAPMCPSMDLPPSSGSVAGQAGPSAPVPSPGEIYAIQIHQCARVLGSIYDVYIDCPE